jgi:hypothetical protein
MTEFFKALVIETSKLFGIWNLGFGALEVDATRHHSFS